MKIRLTKEDAHKRVFSLGKHDVIVTSHPRGLWVARWPDGKRTEHDSLGDVRDDIQDALEVAWANLWRK